MKDIILIAWLGILFLNPLVDNYTDYISIQQMEIAFAMTGLLYIAMNYTRRVIVSLLWVFTIYYNWVWLTDKYIDNIPLWISNLESLLFFIISIYKVKFDKRL